MELQVSFLEPPKVLYLYCPMALEPLLLIVVTADISSPFLVLEFLEGQNCVWFMSVSPQQSQYLDV